MIENKSKSVETSNKHYVKTGIKHSFIRGKLLEVRILDCSGKPIKKISCKITFSNDIMNKGITDENGWLKIAFTGTPEYADIILEGVDEDNERKVYIKFDSIEKNEDLKGRLFNLGFIAEEDTSKAVLDFQEFYNLELTGEINNEFKSKLDEIYKKYGNEKIEEEDYDDSSIDEGEDRT